MSTIPPIAVLLGGNGSGSGSGGADSGRLSRVHHRPPATAATTTTTTTAAAASIQASELGRALTPARANPGHTRLRERILLLPAAARGATRPAVHPVLLFQEQDHRAGRVQEKTGPGQG